MNEELASALLKEYFKSWDHFVSDELTHFFDSEKGNFKGRSEFVNWPTKYEMRKAYLDIYIILGGKGGDVQFRAIVDAESLHPNTWGMTGVDPDLSRIDRERGMLVEITEHTESPDGVFSEVIPSIVRLKRLDGFDCLTGDIPCDTPKPFLASFRTVDMDRKVGISGRFAPTQEGELPCELTKTGPEVVGQLTSQKRDFLGDNGFKAADVHSLFSIILFRNGYRVALKKHADFFLKSFEVFFRPHGFNPCMVQPVHVTQTASGHSLETADSSA